jgi:hypothetical protein
MERATTAPRAFYEASEPGRLIRREIDDAGVADLVVDADRCSHRPAASRLRSSPMARRWHSRRRRGEAGRQQPRAGADETSGARPPWSLVRLGRRPRCSDDVGQSFPLASGQIRRSAVSPRSRRGRHSQQRDRRHHWGGLTSSKPDRRRSRTRRADFSWAGARCIPCASRQAANCDARPTGWSRERQFMLSTDLKPP